MAAMVANSRANLRDVGRLNAGDRLDVVGRELGGALFKLREAVRVCLST